MPTTRRQDNYIIDPPSYSDTLGSATISNCVGYYSQDGYTLLASDTPVYQNVNRDKTLITQKIDYVRGLNKDNTKNIPFLEEGIVYNFREVVREIELYHRIDDSIALYAIADNNILYDNNIELKDFKSKVRLAYRSVVLKNIPYITGRFNFDLDDYFFTDIFSSKRTEKIIKEGNTSKYFDRKMIENIRDVACVYLLSSDDGDLVSEHTVIAPHITISEAESVDNNTLWKIFRNTCDFARRKAIDTIQEHERRREIQNRRPDTISPRFRSSKLGEYVKHKVPFAVELELYGTNQSTVAKMSREIAREWGVCRDGSLTSNIGYPVEIQSPILLGSKGEQNIIETCNTLKDLNFEVDRTCGMHVHFGCGDAFIRSEGIRTNREKPSNLISLYLFHRLFEDVIVSFLPSTRRANHYCGQFKNGVEYRGAVHHLGSIDEAFSTMDNINTLQQFELYWYRANNKDHVSKLKHERYTVSRYMGVNFHSLLKENHIEIRYHSGTKNYEKILYWINLHGKIIEMCASGVINQKMLRGIKSECLNLEQLTMRMFDILKMDKDTVEYLMDRQARLIKADTEQIDEIAISKTKKLEII